MWSTKIYDLSSEPAMQMLNLIDAHLTYSKWSTFQSAREGVAVLYLYTALSLFLYWKMDEYRPVQQQQWSPYAWNGGYDSYKNSIVKIITIVYPCTQASRDSNYAIRITCIHIILFICRTILAIAGENFSVIASDSRLSEGFQIYSRDNPKTYKLSV